MSDGSRAQVYYVEESSWGTTPASALQELRYTSESLARSHGSKVSEEVRSDRQVTDVVRTAIEAAGDISFELSYGTYDDLLEGAMADDWSSAISVTGTVHSAANADSSYNRSSGSYVTDGFVAGMWIRVSGFANAANNGLKRIETVAALKIVVQSTLTTEAAGPSVTLKNGGQLVNGTTKKSYTLEKVFEDVAEYMAFTGMRVAKAALNIKPGEVITGSFTFQGKNGVASGATVGTGSPTTANANGVVNAVDHIVAIREGGAATTLDVQELSLSIENNARSLAAVGSATPVEVGLGRCVVTGTMVCYFESRAIYEKFADQTESDFAIAVQDTAGNQIVLDIARLKFTNGEVLAGGNDTDVVVSLEFQAIRDATEDSTLTINRIAA